MNVAVAREEGSDLQGALDALLPVEPDLPYANFAPLAARPGATLALLRARCLDPANRIGVFVARERCGRPLAAVRVEQRPFESEHFGLRMAKIDQPLATTDPPARSLALRELFRGVFDALSDAGYQHVAARASTRDRTTSWVLQELGAVNVDTQVSWMCPLSGLPHDDAVPAGFTLEVHDRNSIATVPATAWTRLAHWAARAFDRGPFVFDLTLPRDRAMGIYQAWTEKVMRGEWADAVLIVRRDAEVVAFISMLLLADLSEASGVRVCGRGLGATLPEYRGLFTAIQREMIAVRPLDASFMENETQVATIGSINVYAKLGFRYLRSTSTFHRRLDGAPPL